MSYTGAPPRRPGPPLWLALVLLVSGVVVAFATAAVFAAKAIGTDSSAPTFSTPGSERLYLRPGAYDVFTDGSAATLSTSDVTISDAGGKAVALSQLTAGQSYENGNTTYHAALTFRVTRAGQYSVDVTGDADYSSVAPDLTTIISWNGGWLAGLLASLVVGLTGLVLLVVGLIRRSQLKRRAGLSTTAGGYGAPGPWTGQSWPAPGSMPHGMPPPGGRPGETWHQPQWPPAGSWPAPTTTAGPAAVPQPAGYAAVAPSAPPHPSGWSPHPTPRPAQPAAEPSPGGAPPPGRAEPDQNTGPDRGPEPVERAGPPGPGQPGDQPPPPSGGLGP